MPSAQQTADQAAMDQIMAVQLRILEQKMQHAKEAQRRAGPLELQHEAQRLALRIILNIETRHHYTCVR